MMLRWTITILLYVLLFAWQAKHGYAADYEKEADSLKLLLKTAAGNERADALIKLGTSLYRLKREKEEILPLLQEALAISESTNYLQGKAGAYSIMGAVYSTAGDNEKCISLYKKAAGFYELSGDWVHHYRHWIGISRRYYRLEKYDSAFLYTDMVINTFKKPDQWVCRIVAHLYNSDYYVSAGEFNKELVELKILFDSTLYYYKENEEIPQKHALIYVSKLKAWYSRHGYYKKAIACNLQLLDSLYKFNFDPKDLYYQKGKCYGSMAMAFSDWGRYDSALIYHKISEHYFDSAIMIAGNGVDYVINKANQIEGTAIVQTRLGNFEEAEQNFRKSLALREEKNDKMGVAMCYDGLAELYQYQGKYTQALELFQKALEIKKNYKSAKIQNYPKDNIQRILTMANRSLITTYLKLGNLFKEWSNNVLALENYQQALALAIEVGERKSEADVLIALGDIRLNDQENINNPKEYLQALEIAMAIDNRSLLGVVNDRLGDYYLKNRQYLIARNYFQKAVQVFTELGMQRDLAETWLSMAKISYSLKRYHDALEKYKSCLSIAESLNLKNAMMQANEGISKTYEVLGQTDEAFRHYRLYIAARDSIYTAESNKMIEEVKAEYEMIQKDQEISLLKSQNELQLFKIERSQYILLSVGGLVLLLTISGILFIRQERLRMGQKNILLQQKLLRTQMNPHFIFNALTNIQSFMVTHRIDQAGNYLTRFSRLLRDILTNSREEQISLDREINTIENYLSLQQLRYSNRFDYVIDVQQALDVDDIMIPPMLAQPFIENAIEHGIRHKKEKGKIRVQLMQVDHHLQLEVEDNGVGRAKARELEKDEEKDHLSMATSITRERIDFLRRRYRKYIEMKIEDLFDENGAPSGTKVHFVIPFF
ncbi:MAG: tetratricopeptide repeat protein [Bacteroidetes bacterium]|nr:tetratricopeptide repeat protein [Bacteroidota bacterium]